MADLLMTAPACDQIAHPRAVDGIEARQSFRDEDLLAARAHAGVGAHGGSLHCGSHISSMCGKVCLTIGDLQILGGVVSFVAVSVVNDVIRCEWAPNPSGHYEAVFHAITIRIGHGVVTSDPDCHVSVCISPAPTTPAIRRGSDPPNLVHSSPAALPHGLEYNMTATQVKRG